MFFFQCFHDFPDVWRYASIARVSNNELPVSVVSLASISDNARRTGRVNTLRRKTLTSVSRVLVFFLVSTMFRRQNYVSFTYTSSVTLK